MSRSQKLAAIVMTVLSGIAIYGFFAFRYPYHLHFQEQYQLFESTRDYFTAVAAVPGGFADWAGRFLTQFCYYAPAGAVLTALLLCAVQLMTWAACRQKTLTLYALSFLPSALLLAFYCDENALAGAAVALILSLAAAVLIRRVSQHRLRHILEVFLVPVLYMLCGPLTIVYVLTILIIEMPDQVRHEEIPERNEANSFWLLLGSMVVLTVVCPFISRYIFPYPLERLYAGVHYYRYHNILPGLLWMAAVASVAVIGLSCLRTRRLRDRWKLPAGSLLFLLVAALGTFLTLKTADPAKEEWMRYDFMVRMQMWNRIMLTADRHNPDTPKTVSCLNLALSKSGRMADSQFEYFQNGPDGLLPPFARDHTSPVSTGEVFWQLGMVNTAQRYAFEAQEAIPDFQKSARLYQRLAETNIVNGDWDVARKYLKALQHARFYRKWARETLALLDAGTIFERRPELARIRNLRLKEHDFLFSDTEMDSMLGLLNVEHPENTMALDYLMAWALLKKDLDRFVECIGLLQTPQMPKAYQEALLLRWVMTHSNFDGLPPYLSQSHARRINAFLTDMRAGKTEEQMRQAYGDTYWFYYYYRYRTRPE